jgi:hypothetical protein
MVNKKVMIESRRLMPCLGGPTFMKIQLKVNFHKYSRSLYLLTTRNNIRSKNAPVHSY